MTTSQIFIFSLLFILLCNAIAGLVILLRKKKTQKQKTYGIISIGIFIIAIILAVIVFLKPLNMFSHRY